MEAIEALNYGWLSLMPPIIAIILALITKEVIISLILGILSGALIYSNGNVIHMLANTFEVMSQKMGENANILIFLGLLGAIVVIVTKAGGSAAYGNWAVKKINNRKGAALATSALGCLIFIDDYFNCLTVGTVMRPVTDKHRISRAKLAYLLDATAAPICIIAPISSWGASVATYMQDAGVSNGMATFISTIPYNLYAILTIVMVIIICLTNVNYGPMKKFETNAMEHGDLFSNENRVEEQEAEVNISSKGKVYDLLIPIGSLIFFTVLAMEYTGGYFDGKVSFFRSFGESDAALALVMGSFTALIITFFLFIPRKIIGFKEFMEGISEGIKSMVPAFIILILAWTISGICSTEYLNTGGYVGHLVLELNFPIAILPMITFLVAGFLGFATGTSWGTMALLIPIGVAICMDPTTSRYLLPMLGSILGGAVYGDHISLISDTTILSSAGAGCNHLDHVSTQFVYATTVAISCLVGYGLMGITQTAWIPFVISMGLLFLLLYIANSFSKSS